MRAMTTAKKIALDAIAGLPEDADPHAIVASLLRAYRTESGAARLQSTDGSSAEPLPPGLELVDGLLVYTGALGAVVDDPVALAREARIAELQS
jgi:hypothetical protein